MLSYIIFMPLLETAFDWDCSGTVTTFYIWSSSSFFFFSLTVPVDLSPEERSELEDIRRRKGVLLQEIQRLREELREAILEVEGLETSTEGR